MIDKAGRVEPAIDPIETPEIIIGSIIEDIPISIYRPFPFFKGCGIFARSAYLITLARAMLIFEIAIAFFESKLKNAWDVGTIVPPPLIPPMFTSVSTVIVPIIPHNSYVFTGNKSLWAQNPFVEFGAI